MIERIIGELFQPFLEKAIAYGPNQYAYLRGCGSKYALAITVLSWLRFFDDGKRVGLYCSDVAGAFDRVSKNRLMLKLRAKGLHEQIIVLIDSWLDTRTAYVIVDGNASKSSELKKIVYQGTVWGPTLELLLRRRPSCSDHDRFSRNCFC